MVACQRTGYTSFNLYHFTFHTRFSSGKGCEGSSPRFTLFWYRNCMLNKKRVQKYYIPVKVALCHPIEKEREGGAQGSLVCYTRIPH